MIQRLQSIFLLLSALFFGSHFFTGFASTSESVQGLFSDLSYNIFDNPILIGLVAIGALLSLISIFLYNNRKVQLKLTYITVTIAILMPVVAVLIFYNQMTGLETTAINDDLGLYTPIGSVIFGILAGRYIKKDQKLVSSMDRLR